MKSILIGLAVASTLAGCSGNLRSNSAILNTGADVSFLRQGVSSCPGVAQSNNPIYEQYPLRCGPQAQVIPR